MAAKYRSMELFKMIKNFFFCLKYPFWKITDDWYNYNTSIGDKRKGSKNFFVVYNYTWYDDIPDGWRIAFGKKLSKEIKNTFKKAKKNNPKLKWKDVLHFQQIKEKYGELYLYADAIKEIRAVLDKYELLSTGYCIDCGQPARYRTKGWIEYYCEKCFTSHRAIYLNQDKVQKEMKECRLTKEDIPILRSYHKGMNGKLISKKVNIKKKYGIDFKELWGLK